MPDHPLLALYLLGAYAFAIIAVVLALQAPHTIPMAARQTGMPPLVFAVVYALAWGLLWPVMVAVFIAHARRGR